MFLKSAFFNAIKVKTPAFSEQTEADDTAGDHCDARGGEDDDTATRGSVGRSVGTFRLLGRRWMRLPWTEHVEPKRPHWRPADGRYTESLGANE